MLTGIRSAIKGRYPDAMAATDPIAPEPRRFSIRLPHWGWFLLATVVLVVGFVGLSVWLPYHQEQQVIGMLEA